MRQVLSVCYERGPISLLAPELVMYYYTHCTTNYPLQYSLLPLLTKNVLKLLLVIQICLNILRIITVLVVKKKITAALIH